jgi:hypothetical protein
MVSRIGIMMLPFWITDKNVPGWQSNSIKYNLA